MHVRDRKDRRLFHLWLELSKKDVNLIWFVCASPEAEFTHLDLNYAEGIVKIKIEDMK